MAIIRDVEVELDGIKISCKPTLAKIAQIEEQFGPAVTILRKLGAGELGIAQMVAIVAIMVRGERLAPGPREVNDIIYKAKVFNFVPAIADFITAAITTDEPSAAAPAEGN